MPNTDSCIALVITDKETNAQIKNLGVGLLELRADLFKKLDAAYIVAQIRRRRLLGKPLLLTLRNQKKEGALNEFSDRLKMEIIEEALPLVDAVDIELSSPLLKQVVAMARKLKKKVIVSSHYLQGTPKNLESILKKSLKAKGDFVKIAAKAGSFDDVMALLAFTRRHRKLNMITMSLGRKGALSRVLFPAAGSRYTYTFLNKPAAEGQIDFPTLKSHLKVYYSSIE
ncbi:MAG: type I 3-dehydroquinate dehydratase [Candidatus Omnitrophica bacterium]|nr:type I 3-dehydroquinate dehydratase [Candidatus Omnitrophota bacterium]MDE2009265.1 type I 3-dehydroquinate dehydratase [Candidatus Omnitrophota bacterium]MDE2213785.1 type I 3-dehydroquinate dehydratase [Candidatus Omnitrophota bacterium]MDE2230639.1 type I 3-dehydroquinate dehydratase [Candidatus Omnitrophota bacterium]